MRSNASTVCVSLAYRSQGRDMAYKLRRTIGKRDYSKPDIPVTKYAAAIDAGTVALSEFVHSTERAASAMEQMRDFDYAALEARIIAALAEDNAVVREIRDFALQTQTPDRPQAAEINPFRNYLGSVTGRLSRGRPSEGS